MVVAKVITFSFSSLQSAKTWVRQNTHIRTNLRVMQFFHGNQTWFEGRLFVYVPAQSGGGSMWSWSLVCMVKGRNKIFRSVCGNKEGRGENILQKPAGRLGLKRVLLASPKSGPKCWHKSYCSPIAVSPQRSISDNKFAEPHALTNATQWWWWWCCCLRAMCVQLGSRASFGLFGLRRSESGDDAWTKKFFSKNTLAADELRASCIISSDGRGVFSDCRCPLRIDMTRCSFGKPLKLRSHFMTDRSWMCWNLCVNHAWSYLQLTQDN